MSKILCSISAALFLTGCCGQVNLPNPSHLFGSKAPSCEAPPTLTAPPPKAESLCGPLPAEALPGQTWCCEAIPMAAAPPQRVCTCPEQVKRTPIPAEYETVTEQVETAPARTEWQRVPCASGGDDCWALINIAAQFETRTRQRLVREAYEKVEYAPAQFENVASAPPAPIYRWVRHHECEVAPSSQIATSPAQAVIPPPPSPNAR